MNIEKEILKIQESNNDGSLNDLERALRSKYEDLLAKEEIYCHQRSRIRWITHGDKNTKFFHAYASWRKRKNSIQQILNDDNQWIQNCSEIIRPFVNHFRAIFSTTNPPSIFQQLTRGSLERWAVLHAEDLSHLCNIPEEKERRKLYSTMWYVKGIRPMFMGLNLSLICLRSMGFPALLLVG